MGAQDLVRGIFNVGRQAVEGLANRAATASDGGDGVFNAQGNAGGTTASHPGFDPLSRSPVGESNWQASSQQPSAGGGLSPVASPAVGYELVAELQQRVQTLEREKAAVTEKAKQFLAMKTQELKARNTELQDHVTTLTEKVGSLETMSAGAGQENNEVRALQSKVSDLEAQLASSAQRDIDMQELQQKVVELEGKLALSAKSNAEALRRQKEEFEEKLVASEQQDAEVIAPSSLVHH